VSRHVLVALLVTVVLLDVMEVIAADDDGALHLVGHYNTTQQLATDGNVASPGALLVDVGALLRVKGCLEA